VSKTKKARRKKQGEALKKSPDKPVPGAAAGVNKCDDHAKKAIPKIEIAAPKIVVAKKSYQAKAQRLEVIAKVTDEAGAALEFDGKAVLEIAKGSDKVKLFDAKGAALKLPLRLRGKVPAEQTFFVEGVKGSDAPDDVELSWTLKAGKKCKVGSPSTASGKLSVADLSLKKVDARFAPGIEKLEMGYDIHRLDGEKVFVEIRSESYPGKCVFKRELTAAEKTTGAKRTLEWDGKGNQAGDLNGKWATAAFSPYEAILEVDKSGTLKAELKEKKPTAVEIDKVEIKIEEDASHRLFMNDPAHKALVESKVLVKKKAGGSAVTPVEFELAYTFTEGASNTAHGSSHAYSGTTKLGKKGDAAAIHWADHADCTSRSTDGYKKKCFAKTIVAAGANQGKSRIWFKPSGVGGDKFKVKGELFKADGTTSLASKETNEVAIWRRVSLKCYEMTGQTHASTQGTDVKMAAYYTADTNVLYKLGTVTTIPAAKSVKYIGLWNHATTAQLSWATHQRKKAAETPTAADTTAANGPAGPAQAAARARIQAKAHAWRNRIVAAYNSGLNNWATDAGVPARALVSIQYEHPKYSAGAGADSTTAEWTAFPWLRIRVERWTIHPDRRWVQGQGVAFGGRAYITAGMSAARTKVVIAHEAGHETKNQFKRASFGAGDHSAIAGLMDPSGSLASFQAGEKKILRGKT